MKNVKTDVYRIPHFVHIVKNFNVINCALTEQRGWNVK